MGNPSSDQIHAALDQMRTTANKWEEAAGFLDSALSKTELVKFTNIEAGVFALSYNKYSPTPTYAGDRAREGAAACREIAATLRDVANVYEEEDRRGEHALRGLY